MNPRYSTYLAAVCLLALTSLVQAAEEKDSDFRDVLELAGLSAETLATFSDGPDYSKEDWQLLVKLIYRLDLYPAKQLTLWAKSWNSQAELELGNLYEVSGKVDSLEVLSMPDDLSKLQSRPKLYRCQFRVEDSNTKLIVLTSRVPKRWLNRNLSAGEPVRFHGVLLKAQAEWQPLGVMLTDRFSWYPTKNVPLGQALLAKYGFDVALFDEVIHRKPFVKSTVSREGDAFYACLATISQVDGQELAALARENVTMVAEKWRKVREPLTKQQIAIGASVLERSRVGVSSVAPLFLQPEQEVGELVHLEGTARRAVQIVVSDRPELETYYELEVFPPDSQDLPVVCCATSLPSGFPMGDKIREPVQISGIFFKSWQYRSRKLISTNGETNRQQRLYTPIVVTRRPVWLTDANAQPSLWGLRGGVAFLVVLVILWIYMAKLGRQDRIVRNASRQSQVLDQQHPSLSENDSPKNEI